MGVAWDSLGKGGPRTDADFDAPGSKEHPRRSQDQQRVRAKASRNMQVWHEAWARETLRVLKPGGHLLAFGGSRTYHRLACAVEDAGFEIRDSLIWLYGSGFPKSLNVGDGRGTALKPGHEPVVVARKPLAGTVAENVLEHGTGALNIDACRVGDDGGRSVWAEGGEDARGGDAVNAYGSGLNGSSSAPLVPGLGRWPANVALDQAAAAELDEQSGELVSGANPTRRGSTKFAATYGDFVGQEECEPARGMDVGGASRFFYCAKASSAERNAGLTGMPTSAERLTTSPTSTLATGRSGGRRLGDRKYQPAPAANVHPTVKPVDLMRWLVRLVTPPGGLVLDPFTGSGTTGCAAVLEGFRFLGVERDEEYATIARARIAAWAQMPPGTDTERAAQAIGERGQVAAAGQDALFAV